MMVSTAHRRPTLTLFAALLFAGAPAIQAVEHPNVERGYEPQKAFQLGDLDTINRFNGNLTLALPLGGEYPAGGALRYQLSLTYNSTLWDFDQLTGCTGCPLPLAIPGRRFNAGLGWQLTLGDLLPPFAPDNNTNAWVYLGPDGGEHSFFSTLHGDEPAVAGASYTRDGSYLRLVTAGAERQVQAPDGTVHIFEQVGPDAWRLRRMEDPFGNHLDIDYLSSGGLPIWRLSDGFREHRIYFRTTVSPAYEFIVDRVELAAFGGATATYAFSYVERTVVKPCPHGDSDLTITVPLLVSVQRPDGSSFGAPEADYDFGTVPVGAGVCNDPRVGQLNALDLPTGGRIGWQFGAYEFPHRAADPPFLNASWGVVERQLYHPDGTAFGAPWTFEPRLEIPPSPLPGQPEQPARELVNTVTDPLGHVTEHYFSVYPGGLNPSPAFVQEEYSLPLTRYQDDGGGRFLSTRTFDASGQLLRSTYLRYEGGTVLACPNAFTRCPFANSRVVSQRSVFHDDVDATSGATRYADVDRADFDGLGHYRQETTGGNFGAGDVSQAVTRFNPGRGTYLPGSGGTFVPPALGEPWQLTSYDLQRVSEGGASVEEQLCLEAGTGFVLRRRQLRSGTVRGAHDLVSVYQRDARGQVTRESFHGGDAQSLPTSASWCSAALGAAEVELRHEYSCGERQRSAYLDAAGAELPFNAQQQDIDCPSGQIARSYDVAGLWTDLLYDSLGRLTWSRPGGPAGQSTDGWTEYRYHAAIGSSPARVEVLRRSGASTSASIAARSELEVDGFGRLARERRLLPSLAWSERFTEYDALGQRTAVSEWDAPAARTQYLAYDPFGRPGRVRGPDGFETILFYTGSRQVVRQVQVATERDGAGSPVFSAARRVEVYDRQGRLWRAREQSIAGGDLETTEYSYDPAGRLTQVVMGSQERRFSYDGAGLLTSERYPETGSAGNGFTTYPEHNARGQVLRRRAGETGGSYASDLRYTYDRAERLIRVADAGDGSVVHKEFVYAGQQSGTNRQLGKLIRAVRHNRVENPLSPPNLAVIPITEEYEYRGRGGRTSLRRTSIPTAGESYQFEQSWSYDALGQVEAVSYPRCLHTACSGELGTANARTVSSSYLQGQLVAVSGYASLISYHGNGALAAVVHASGATDLFERDPNSQQRPRRLQVTGVTSGWDSGLYAYDGAANLIAMGGDWFTYDEASRLARSSQQVDGDAWEQSFAYDRYGNLTTVGTRVNSGPWSFRSFGINPSTNRILSSQVSYDAEGNLTRWGPETQSFDPFGLIRNTPGRAYLYTAGDERLWVFDATSGTSQQVETFTLRDLDGRPLRRYRVATTGPSPPNAGNILFADGFETGDVSCWTATQGFEGATGVCGQRRWQLERDYIWAGSRLLAAETPQGPQHYHLDHLGTPRLITDAAGTTAALHTYFPFGDEATATQNTEPLKFTGHERDLNAPGAGDDLDYLHARYYKPLLCRFLSVDPARSAQPNQPQTWNRYAYVANNPMGAVDPDGRERAQILLDQDNRAYLSGEITSAELESRVEARGAGALIAGSFFVPGPEDLVLGALLRTGPVVRVLEAVSLRGGGFLRRVFGARKAAEAVAEGASEAKSATRAVKLQKQLANEEQVGELVGGGGQSMAGAGGRVPIRDVDRLVGQYGGSASDYAKIRSSSFKAADGTSFEVHAYRNVRTGEVFELKTKLY